MISRVVVEFGGAVLSELHAQASDTQIRTSARIDLILKRAVNKKVPPTSIFLRQGKQASAGLV
jgi:hypothetical protein